MSAPRGNNNKMKYKTSEERRALCERFCAHIEQGYSKKSFEECCLFTINRYIADFPEDFVGIEEAYRKNLKFWEALGIDGTAGNIKNFNSRSWEFNMKNRFREDWADSKEITGPGGSELVPPQINVHVVKKDD